MSRKHTAKATAAHMRNAELRREQAAYTENSPKGKVSAAEMVAASLYTGMTYAQQHDSLQMMNIIPSSRSSCFRKLKEVESKIKEATDASTQRARDEFSGFAAIDGRWSHRIRASEGSVILADIKSPERKVLARETLILDGGGRQNPNYSGHPGNMESEGTERMFQKLANEGFLDKITVLTRDRDNKSGKILEKYGLSDREYHEPGHNKKNFSSIFEKFFKKYQKYEYDEACGTVAFINAPFRGLQGPLEHYLAKVMKLEDADARESMWMNAVNHFIGDHSFCDHDQKEQSYFWRIGYDHTPLQKVLYNFLLKTAPVVRKLYSKYRSQLIEAINNEIANSAPKNISWKKIEVRVDAAILKHNEPENAYQIIGECCGLNEPCEEIQNRWRKENSSKIRRREESHEQESIRAKNKLRYQAKNKINETAKCDYQKKK